MNRVKNKSHPSRVIPLSTPGTASMVGIVILWHPLWAIEESVGTTSRDASRLRLDYRVIHDHARNACHPLPARARRYGACPGPPPSCVLSSEPESLPACGSDRDHPFGTPR